MKLNNFIILYLFILIFRKIHFKSLSSVKINEQGFSNITNTNNFLFNNMEDMYYFLAFTSPSVETIETGNISEYKKIIETVITGLYNFQIDFVHGLIRRLKKKIIGNWYI